MPAEGLIARGLRVSGRAGAPVRGVDLDLRVGEVVALVGPSGAGKSLCLRALVGLLPDGLVAAAERLELRLGARVHHPLRDGWGAVRGGGLGWLPQDAGAALDPLRTVGQQLGATARRAGQAPDPGPWLEAAGLDPAVARRLPGELSGGMAQRALLAQALATGARLLLADEPTTGLDPRRAAEVADALVARARDGHHGVLWVTHDLRALPGRVDRIALVVAGRTVEIVEGDDPRALSSPEGRALYEATRRVAAGALG